jgi:hypothetical protein
MEFQAMFHTAGPFSDLVNCSFLEGVFPDNLRLAKILASFKNKGERSDPSNYRPISQTPAVSKIVEKCFANQTDKYFSENNLYSPN